MFSCLTFSSESVRCHRRHRKFTPKPKLKSITSITLITLITHMTPITPITPIAISVMGGNTYNTYNTYNTHNTYNNLRHRVEVKQTSPLWSTDWQWSKHHHFEVQTGSQASINHFGVQTGSQANITTSEYTLAVKQTSPLWRADWQPSKHRHFRIQTGSKWFLLLRSRAIT